MKFSLSSSGFTLVELMIAMTIFGIMSTMMVSVYFNATNTSRKLNYARELSETAREITERIALDIHDHGLSVNDPNIDGAYNPWSVLNYTGTGNEVLVTGVPPNEHVYLYGKKTNAGIAPCLDSDKNTSTIHCGLYLREGSEYFNLVDSFIPEDEKKRVKIQDLAFYITGDNLTTPKVTIIFTLRLMPRAGISSTLMSSTELHIETTISDRIWRH